MDKVTAVRKRLNREQWEPLISESFSSGMTVSRWCKEKNLRANVLKNLKKLREEMIESLPSPIPVANELPDTFRKLEFQTAISDLKASIFPTQLWKSKMVQYKKLWRQCASTEIHMLGDITVAQNIYIAEDNYYGKNRR